jgi:curli biogenesis system outer membrane secretion channel CsgG
MTSGRFDASVDRRAILAAAAFLLSIFAAGCGGSPPPVETNTVADNATAAKAATASLPEKILVLPFENRSQSRERALGTLMTELFVSQLRHLPVTIIPPSTLISAYADANRPVPTQYDRQTLVELADLTGCDAVILGAVTQYESGRSLSDDRIGFDVRIIDARTGTRLFATTYVATGEDVDPTIRGIDQLTLLGVRKVTERIARAR